MKYLFPYFLFLTFFSANLFAQKIENAAIKERIEAYKSDARGPYKDIRWFCSDGSFAIPREEKCPEVKGKVSVQRARYKDEVVALGKSNHIFLGQILSTTPKEDFWDEANYNSRLKQYQLEKYLRAVDDGWVLRKGQYYRGAFQVEDEEAWGIDFLTWLLSKDEPLEKQFFLVRQAAKDIPHRGDDSRTLNVRAVSKTISDDFPAFMNLRVKIHGQPEYSDIAKVKDFKEKNSAKLSAKLQQQFDELIADMEKVYQPIDLHSLNRFLKEVPKESPVHQSLTNYINNYPTAGMGRLMATAENLAEIRKEIINIKSRKARLAMLDLSNALEEIYFTETSQWQPTTVEETMDKICYSGMVAMGTGFIEEWEWDVLSHTLALPEKESMTLAELTNFNEKARSLVEWGTGMVRGVYKDVVNSFGGFEPLAYGYFDDRIRGSVLLNLGMTVGQLGDYIAKEAKLSNQIAGAGNQSTFRGLNPGFAMGELVVVSGNEEEADVSKDKIYIFNHPPSDLKPVAGIATVSEGNMVSHVQLLARNLGIPNAVLSTENLSDLERMSGQKVFYAVSNRGTVILKKASDMTDEERQLFEVKKRSEERITVPVEKIDLAQKSVLDLRNVNASHSGKLCGPKAANLGQLKVTFPDHVVEGLVIPFGIFREHLNQDMPGQEGTYWFFLNSAFQKARAMKDSGQSDEEVENYALSQLAILREGIQKINLLPSFVSDLENGFANVLGQPIGNVPVFLRSDTNMEDLKDFTGAGLNLTLFNVVDKEKILQGIKDVWASPYTERSFKWRQRYLLNPENVFPSILIIPSVDVDYSGVLITKGITTGDPRDLTIAFSRGAGGAVDGQAAESYLLHHSQYNYLLSPAREPSYRRLPATGGTATKYATFESPILNYENVTDIRQLAFDTYQKLYKPGSTESQGPFDIELGFQDNKLWLFQIRPFVENKNAMSSAYLESITPKIDEGKMISLDNKIQ